MEKCFLPLHARQKSVNKMCSKKYNEILNDEVRWTSGSSSRKKGDTSYDEELQLASAKPTVTSIRQHTHSTHNNQSSSIVDVNSDTGDSKCINFINSIRQKFMLSPLSSSQLNTKNKSILYQFIVLYLVLNIICNNLLLTTLLPCVSADELMDAPGARGHYTPTWAVHIPGGDQIAQQVADDHGYVLLGKVSSSLFNFYFTVCCCFKWSMKIACSFMFDLV